MASNKDLTQARVNKADEFYTSYEDIEKEMSRYSSDVFENKKIILPCDSIQSKFFTYFVDNFIQLKLKALLAVSLDEQVFVKEENGELFITRGTIEDGDFRTSDTVKAYLKSADIVITNPPFSLFREFMNLIFEYEKDYIILGNMNAITYKEIFPQILSKKMNLGCSIHSGDRLFKVHDDYELTGTSNSQDESGKYIRVKGVRWFTNITSHDYEIKPVILLNKYSEENYKKFDTYDAINVNSMKEIPYDYYDEIGAPITVIDKMNKDGLLEFYTEDGNKVLFEVKGQLNSGNNVNNDFAKPIIDSKCKFKRILINQLSTKKSLL